MKLSEAVVQFQANRDNLATQPDAALFALQNKADRAIDSMKEWSADVRESLKDDAEVNVDDFLQPTAERVSILAELSEFITATTTTRYGCQD